MSHNSCPLSLYIGEFSIRDLECARYRQPRDQRPSAHAGRFAPCGFSSFWWFVLSNQWFLNCFFYDSTTCFAVKLMGFHWICDSMVVVASLVVPSVVPPAVAPRVVGLWIPTARIGDQVPKIAPPQPVVYRLVIETVKDPSTAVENIIP